jgi:hypothetical protein
VKQALAYFTVHPYRAWTSTLTGTKMCLTCGRGKLAVRHLLFGTDPDAWLGWTADPAETTRFCAWLRVGHSMRIYAYPWRMKIYTEPCPDHRAGWWDKTFRWPRCKSCGHRVNYLGRAPRQTRYTWPWKWPAELTGRRRARTGGE